MNEIGATFTLKDLALGLLFPLYWKKYRTYCSKQNVFKIKILDKVDGINEVVLMEVSPMEGRVVLPNGVSNFITDDVIDVAVRYSSRQDEYSIPDEVEHEWE